MDTDKSNRLNELRGEIDAIDADLLALLNRRAAVSMEVGRVKGGNGPVYRPRREEEVLGRLRVQNEGILPDTHIRNIWREIFSSSRALQRRMRVAYLGPEGTFSYFAGVAFLGRSNDFLPCTDIHGAFQAVASGEAEVAVVPLENSLEGTVGQTLDLFQRFPVTIRAELFSRISHTLLAKEGGLGEIEVVYSHPQPLAQCGGWLRANLPGARLVPVESTAAAARRAADTPRSAAIGHRSLARKLDLTALATAIEDTSDNWTRFVVIAPESHDVESAKAEPLDAPAKTSIVFTLPDRPGALHSALDAITAAGVNMSKLESRPLRGETWQYVFFMDLECDLARPEIRAAVERLGNATRTMRVLGCYAAGSYLDGERETDEG